MRPPSPVGLRGQVEVVAAGQVDADLVGYRAADPFDQDVVMAAHVQQQAGLRQLAERGMVDVAPLRQQAVAAPAVPDTEETPAACGKRCRPGIEKRSEEQTSELQS